MFPPLTPSREQAAVQLLHNAGLLSRDEAKKSLIESCSSQQKLCGDGSNRRFVRIFHGGQTVCVLVVPAGKEPDDLGEAESVWHIGNHLHDCDVPVPKIYGWDDQTGMVLFEDLGDMRLYEYIACGESEWLRNDRVENIYKTVISHLAHMQIKGAVDFNSDWCWQSGEYDLELMVERESGYFLRAFWCGFLGNVINPDVVSELKEIANLAATAKSDFFLHRDFQCRNIMIKEGNVRFIDFQGGRRGPLGYDLASLLIDPYAGLSYEMQARMVDYYLTCIGKYTSIERDIFLKQYNFLAFQRNMQIIGAFSFLYKIRKKLFFAEYIRPALHSLAHRLQNPQFAEYAGIKKMVGQGVHCLAK